MGYKVIRKFADLKDGRHLYNVGDAFPHTGYKGEASEERIAELSGNKNKIGAPLIEKVVEENADADGVVPDSEELVRPRSKKVVRKDNDQ